MKEILAPQRPPELTEMVPAGWLDGQEGIDGDGFGFDPQSRKPKSEGFFFADGSPALEGVPELDPKLADSTNGSEHQSVDGSGTEAAESESSAEPAETPQQPESEVQTEEQVQSED